MNINFTFFKLMLLIYLVAGVNSISFGQNEARLDIKRSVTNGYEYIAYLPDGYDENAEKLWPIIIYLHGGQGILDGEVKFGDDVKRNEGLDEFIFGPPALISTKLTGNTRRHSSSTFREWPTEEYIVIIPHLPRDLVNHPGKDKQNDQLWDVTKVARVVDHAVNQYHVNEDRIFMSGISLGAKGVWDYILTDSNTGPPGLDVEFIRPTAAIPISGNGNPSNICNAQDVYIWGIHGIEDGNVDYKEESRSQPGRWGTKKLIEDYNTSCFPSSGRARLSLLPGVRHTNFTEYYDLSAGYDLYEWLDAHGKDKEDNVAPFIQIWNTADSISLTDNSVITLHASVYDSENDNLNLTWSKKSGPEVIFSGDKKADSVIVQFKETGTYVFEFSAKGGGNMSSKEYQVNVASPTSKNLNLNELYLLNASNNEILMTLKNGSKIDTEELGIENYNLGVKYVDKLESVRYTLNENNSYKVIRTGFTKDNFYLFAESPVWIKEDGEYIITVTPYYGKEPSRHPGISKQYAIYVNQDPPVILPVEFLDINAKREGNIVTVSWATASEEGNDFFTIERSPSTSDTFEAIGTVGGAGDSKTIKKYSFTDYAPLGGSAYYRIKQTDFDGKSDYSKIVSVAGSNQFEVSIFPNPAERGDTYLQLSTADHFTKVEVQIADAIGNTYFQNDLAPEQLVTKEGFLLSATKKLSPGLYIMLIKQGEQKVIKKLIIK